MNAFSGKLVFTRAKLGSFRAKKQPLKKFEGHFPEAWLKPRLESGVDCFTCAMFARQRAW